MYTIYILIVYLYVDVIHMCMYSVYDVHPIAYRSPRAAGRRCARRRRRPVVVYGAKKGDKTFGHERQAYECGAARGHIIYDI